MFGMAVGRRFAELGAAADRSALVVIVSTIIQGPRRTVMNLGGAFQCVIWDVEDQNILIGADIIIFVHEDP
jgi:hypothetical protein